MAIRLGITAPVCSVPDAEDAFAAGADEVYFGAMLDRWAELFGESDLLTRRQGRSTHVRQPEEMAAIAELGARLGRRAVLALNGRYVGPQEDAVLDLARMWHDAGGRAAILTDVGLMIRVRELFPGMTIYVSTLACCFNSSAARFFHSLGASRVVLPRDLTIADIADVTRNAPPGMEFEAICLHQKCQFIDGMCGFRHGVRLPSDCPAQFDYHRLSDGEPPVVWSDDPDYEGHGCRMDWRAGCGAVHHLDRDDPRAPHCAACQLSDLAKAGVSHVKIAGRGYPGGVIARSVRFLRDAQAWLEAGLPDDDIHSAIRGLYSRTFSGSCDRSRCYYAAGTEAFQQ